MTESYDLIVIGGGPGGYHAAALAARAGKHVLLIEKAHLGGTCLNAGCIPTKSLLKTAKLYHALQHADAFGVDFTTPPVLNWSRAVARKNETVAALREGVRAMMARAQVTVIEAQAALTDRNTVRANDTDYSAPYIILATGARAVLPDVDGNYLAHVYTSADLLDLSAPPRQLLIYGAHPISLGLAAIFATVGVSVTIMDPAPEIMDGFIDPELAAALRAAMPTVDFRLGASLEAVTPEAAILAGGDKIPVGVVLFNVGRAPNLEAIGTVDVDVHNDGVVTDAFMRTNLPGVYAVGDVTGQHQWAHVALREAETAVNHILGSPRPMRYDHVPVPVYTLPEVAAVGLTDAQARARGHNVRVARLPLTANGRYVTDRLDADGAKGLCKVVVDADTDALLGVHLLGGEAAEMIFGAAALLEDEFRACDVRDLTFAHPTVSEIIKETLLTL